MKNAISPLPKNTTKITYHHAFIKSGVEMDKESDVKESEENRYVSVDDTSSR